MGTSNSLLVGTGNPSQSCVTPGISVYKTLLYNIFYVNILFQLKVSIKIVLRYRIKQGSICSFLYEISKEIKIYVIYHRKELALCDFMFDVLNNIKICPCFNAKKSFLYE